MLNKAGSWDWGEKACLHDSATSLCRTELLPGCLPRSTSLQRRTVADADGCTVVAIWLKSMTAMKGIWPVCCYAAAIDRDDNEDSEAEAETGRTLLQDVSLALPG